MEIKNTAFRDIRFTGDFKMNNLEVVNVFEFLESRFDGIFEGIKIKNIGRDAFINSNFSGSLNLPMCEYIGDRAFYNSNFTQITIGANAELGNYCIGAHSDKFIADYNANGKLAGTYVWDEATQHWIYQ